MKNVKNFFMMRSLFAKTWLISVASIFLTTGLLFLIVSFFADSLIYETQKTNFENQTTKILEYIKKDQMKALDQYIIQGYTIQLDDATLLEGSYEEDKAADSLGSENPKLSIQTNSRVIVDKTKNFQKTAELEKEGKITTVSIHYPIALTQNEIFDLIRNITPYFLFITFIVSSIIAIGYAKYFSNKIKRINHIVDLMALETYPLNVAPVQGDELQELTNNIHIMYFKLRETLDALQEEIVLVRKLEDSRRLFMSGIVHELNTPIMNMKLALSGVYAEETKEEKKIFLKRQLDYLTGMSRLVNELLEVSRVDEKNIHENTDVERVLMDVISVYNEMLEDKQQTIQLDVTAKQTMQIPENNLQRLLSNLLGNAIKYAPEQSEIKIRITERKLTIENMISNTEDELSVEELHKPFITTDKNSDYPSHGIGLYLVQSILQFYNYQHLCTKENGRFNYQIFLNKDLL